MFLTVTPNAVLDKIIFIDEFTPGIPSQAIKLVIGVGGKGLDASVALRHLGQQTTGLCCLAGMTGRELYGLIEKYGILPEPVWVDGETRTAHIIAEQRRHLHTHIFTGGLVITTGQQRAFLERYQQLLPGAGWVLTGGMLPPGAEDRFFRTLVELARQAGAPVLVDSWRKPMLECLAACPTIVKMNRDEFGWTFDCQPANLPELVRSAIQVYENFRLNVLVVTCGPDGIIALTPQGSFRAIPPVQVVVNAAGAGDAASAALAWRLSEGDQWPEALRWAAAVSAASVLTEGTSDLAMEDAVRILPQVNIESI